MEYHQITAKSVITLDTTHLMKLIELFNSFYFRNEVGVGRTFLSSGRMESLMQCPQRGCLQTAGVESHHHILGPVLACTAHHQAKDAAGRKFGGFHPDLGGIVSQFFIIHHNGRPQRQQKLLSLYSLYPNFFFPPLSLMLCLDKERIPRYERQRQILPGNCLAFFPKAGGLVCGGGGRMRKPWYRVDQQKCVGISSHPEV